MQATNQTEYGYKEIGSRSSPTHIGTQYELEMSMGTRYLLTHREFPY